MTLYKLVWHIKRQAAKAGMSMEDFLDWLKRADREGLLPWEGLRMEQVKMVWFCDGVEYSEWVRKPSIRYWVLIKIYGATEE